MGYAPCKLCLWQRWPHAVAMAIGGLILLTGGRGPAWAGALAALTTAAVGLYRSGIERGIFAGPDSCISNGVGA